MKNIPALKKFTAAKIIIAGDTMLDQYWQGAVNRVSPEAPVPIVHIHSEQNRLGGAANVALNVAAWGSHTTLFGICGKDSGGNKIRLLIKDAAIKDKLIISPQVLTITKLRMVAQQQQLLRADFEKWVGALAPRLTKRLLPNLNAKAVLVLSDYDKGTLAEIEKIIAAARKKKMMVLIDPKRIDFSCYAGATMLTPNYYEFSRAVGGCSSHKDMLEKSRTMIRTLSLRALLITCGADGMFLIQPDRTYNIPAYSREVYDITGAGDTVIATLAAGLGAEMSLPDVAELCNFAAGLSVSKMGTGVIGYAEVVQDSEAHSLTPQALMKKVEKARAKKQQIVFTNGVFDILHSGHIAYLRQSARLGDKLIVGINSDKSARRLKGEDRPLNNLEERAMLLNSLTMVDWVVPFDEPTPRKLIALIRPDFLVKGGDYKNKEDVVGYDLVESYGGKVKIMPYVPGKSTSAMLSKKHGLR